LGGGRGPEGPSLVPASAFPPPVCTTPRPSERALPPMAVVTMSGRAAAGASACWVVGWGREGGGQGTGPPTPPGSQVDGAIGATWLQEFKRIVETRPPPPPPYPVAGEGLGKGSVNSDEGCYGAEQWCPSSPWRRGAGHRIGVAVHTYPYSHPHVHTLHIATPEVASSGFKPAFYLRVPSNNTLTSAAVGSHKRPGPWCSRHHARCVHM